MREMFELFSYDQNAAKNEELFRMRYESSIKPWSKDAFATMFFDSRQERLDKLALSDEEIKRLTQKLYYSMA